MPGRYSSSGVAVGAHRTKAGTSRGGSGDLVSRTSPKGCLKHQGHKGDPGVTPGTCGAVGERAQVILVWVRAPGVGNASHPRRLGVMRVRP